MKLDAKTAELIVRKAEAIKCRDSFHYFCNYIFREVDPSKDFINDWYTKAMCDHLEACFRREIKRLVINIPPRHGKSTMVRILFPAWVWLNNPRERFLCTTYQRRLTLRDSRLLRKLIKNKKFQQVVKDLGMTWNLSNEVRTIEGWENTERGSMHSYSIGATTGEGCDFLIIDDLMSVEMARSDVERLNAIEYYDGTLFSRIDRPETGVKIIIMQRLHEWDLTGHVLASKIEDWDHLVLQAEYRENARFKSDTKLGFVDPRTEEGEILCPTITPKYDLLQKREGMGRYFYESQYQQDPVPEGGGIILQDWWKKTTLDEQKARQGVFTLVSIDPAYSEKHERTGSCTARVTLRVFREPLPDGNGYWHRVCLLGMRMEHWAFPELVAETIEYCEKMQPDAVLIENKASGKSLKQSISRKVDRVIAFNPDKYGDKMERMSSIAPLVECGNCYFIPEHKASQEAVDILCRFPADNQDVADAFSQGMLYLERMRLLKAPTDRDYETIIHPKPRLERGYGNQSGDGYTYRTTNFKRRPGYK